MRLPVGILKKKTKMARVAGTGRFFFKIYIYTTYTDHGSGLGFIKVSFQFGLADKIVDLDDGIYIYQVQ